MGALLFSQYVLSLSSLRHFSNPSLCPFSLLANPSHPHLSDGLLPGTGHQPLFPPGPVLKVPQMPTWAEKTMTHRGRGLGGVPPGTARHAKSRQQGGATPAAGAGWC